MRKGDQTRQDMLAAAERLFLSRGYEATSVQDILNVLHASKGGFYHHFSSKEDVLKLLCTQRAERAERIAFVRGADDIDHFSDGLAAVEVDGKWGYINTSGEVVIEPQFSSAQPFVNGTAIVENGLGVGVINTQGEFIMPAAYEYSL